MYADLNVNEGLDFINYAQQTSDFNAIKFDTDFKILSTKVWPFSHENYVTVPKEVKFTQDLFKEYYKELHSKRLLNFVYSQASCILKVNYLKKILDIETSQIWGLILMLFDKPKYKSGRISYNSIVEELHWDELIDTPLRILIYK